VSSPTAMTTLDHGILFSATWYCTSEKDVQDVQKKRLSVPRVHIGGLSGMSGNVWE